MIIVPHGWERPYDECEPHPAEIQKRSGLAQREAEIKDMAPGDHPGWGWWLCKHCGTWHRTYE